MHIRSYVTKHLSLWVYTAPPVRAALMGATKHTQILLSPRVQKQLGLKGKDESYFVNQWLLLGLQVKPTILVVSFF